MIPPSGKAISVTLLHSPDINVADFGRRPFSRVAWVLLLWLSSCHSPATAAMLMHLSKRQTKPICWLCLVGCKVAPADEAGKTSVPQCRAQWPAASSLLGGRSRSLEITPCAGTPLTLPAQSWQLAGWAASHTARVSGRGVHGRPLPRLQVPDQLERLMTFFQCLL